MKVGPVGEDRLYNLAHSEAMTWRVDEVPVAVAESDGPLVVKLRGEVVKMFRWWCTPRMRNGVLEVLDARRQLAVIAEYRNEPGRPPQWDEVIHDWRYAGLY